LTKVSFLQYFYAFSFCSCPISGFWKGIHEPSNKVGLFCTADTLPYVESKVSGVVLRKGKVSRKGIRYKDNSNFFESTVEDDCLLLTNASEVS